MTANSWRAEWELDRILETPEIFRCSAKVGLFWPLFGKTWDLYTWDGDIWIDTFRGFGSVDLLECLKFTEIVHSSVVGVNHPCVQAVKFQGAATKSVEAQWSEKWWNMPSYVTVKLLHLTFPTTRKKSLLLKFPQVLEAVLSTAAFLQSIPMVAQRLSTLSGRQSGKGLCG